jgi:hypothetical protein
MATLVSIATGNFTAAGTWGTSNTASELISSSNNTALTTSYVASSGSTTGAVTIDGIAVWIASRAASPTGTMSVELYNATAAASVAGTEVTINVSDITQGDTSALGGCGWYFFKFSASVLLLAATSYSVRAKTSSSTQVNLYRNATAGNWSRVLRTTTTAAPAANDVLLVMGEWTAAATSTSFTVTIDNTATTTFGAMHISNKSSVVTGTTASTNYYFKNKNIAVFAGGSLDTATGLPSSSTMTINFASSGFAQYGMTVHTGGTFTGLGNPKTNWRSNMTVDKVATNTVITVADTTDWAVGNELAFPSTTRTYSQYEKKTILTVDSATQVTLSAGLTYAHLGTSPTICEVMNITRNVLIAGTGSSDTGYIICRAGSIVSIENVEFKNLGSSGVPCIEIQTTTGSFSMEGCALHDCSNSSTNGIKVTATSGSNISIVDTGIYLVGNNGVSIDASSGVNTYDGIYVIAALGSGLYGFDMQDIGCTFTNNKATSCIGEGLRLSETGAVCGTWDNITSHSNGNVGMTCANVASGTISNVTIWRNNSFGLSIAPSIESTFTIDTGVLFGNNGSNLQLTQSSVVPATNVLKNLTINAGSTLVSNYGVQVNTGAAESFYLENCSLGVTTNHAIADVYTSAAVAPSVFFYNTVFGSPTELSSQTNIYKAYRTAGIVSVNHDGVAGAQKSWSRFGTITTDTTIFNTATPSIRLAPLSASLKLPFAYKIIPVKSGETVTVTVYVRKSDTVSGDSATYNGNQPRLMLRKNLETGITADTVLDTMTAAVGNWEALTATTASASADGAFEFYVDCDGTTGWVNVDDFTTTYVLDFSGMKYWNYGRPAIDGPDPEDGAGGSSGGSWTF